MAKTFKRIIALCIIFILIAVGLSAFVVTGGCAKGSPGAKAHDNIVGTIVDSSGIKDRVDSELRAKAGEISEATGISQPIVEQVIDDIDVKNWEVTTLPDNAVETGTISTNYEGTDIDFTTYEDPSIVTVGAYGQKVTFELPDSAKTYVSFLGYFQ